MSTEMDFVIEDDLGVGEEYPTQDVGPKPPLPGNYRIKIDKWGVRRDKAGNVILWKDANGTPTYPIIGLTTAEIVEPIDNARKVVLFQDVPSSLFQRDGKTASRAGDLLAAFENAPATSNTGETLKALSEFLNGGMELTVRLDYQGYDKDAAAAFVKALPPGATNREKNQAYDKAKIRGYKKIAAANAKAGKPQAQPHLWVGPSGNVIECRPELTIFYPAGTPNVVLGPDKAVVAQIAAFKASQKKS